MSKPENIDKIIVKICGLKTGEEVRWTAEAGADLGGVVVFYPKSKRNMEISEAEALVETAHEHGLKMAAVMVSPGISEVKQACEAGFDFLQIHGEIARDVMEVAEVPIIKAFNVRDIAEYEVYKNDGRIAGFVFDAGIPGSGIGFDHSLLKGLGLEKRSDRFILLAGGLGPDNVLQALRQTGLHGADTSSGVENGERTGKSRGKILSFVEQARRAADGE